MHTFLITTFESSRARQAHAAAAAAFGPLVTNIVEANGYWSFAVFATGSGHRPQASLKSWLQAARYQDGSSPYAWVELQYGDGQTKIVSSSDDDQGQKPRRGR
jgi:hypothetical protein